MSQDNAKDASINRRENQQDLRRKTSATDAWEIICQQPASTEMPNATATRRRGTLRQHAEPHGREVDREPRDLATLTI